MGIITKEQETALAELTAVALTIFHLREMFRYGLVKNEPDSWFTKLYLNMLCCIIYRRRAPIRNPYAKESARTTSVYYLRSKKNSIRRFVTLWIESFILQYATTFVIQLMMSYPKIPSLDSLLNFLVAILITHYSPGDMVFTIAQHDSVKYALNLRFALNKVRSLHNNLEAADANGHGVIFQFVLGVVIMDFFLAFVQAENHFLNWPLALFVRRFPRAAYTFLVSPEMAIGIFATLVTQVGIFTKKRIVHQDNVLSFLLDLLVLVTLFIKYSYNYKRTYYTFDAIAKKPRHALEGAIAFMSQILNLAMVEAQEVYAGAIKNIEIFKADLEHIVEEAQEFSEELLFQLPKTEEEVVSFLWKNKLYLPTMAAMLVAVVRRKYRLYVSKFVMIGAAYRTVTCLLEEDNPQERRQWIVFWIIFQVFETIEEINYAYNNQIPGTFYFLAKITLLHWLTAYNGALEVYQRALVLPEPPKAIDRRAWKEDEDEDEDEFKHNDSNISSVTIETRSIKSSGHDVLITDRAQDLFNEHEGFDEENSKAIHRPNLNAKVMDLHDDLEKEPTEHIEGYSNEKPEKQTITNEYSKMEETRTNHISNSKPSDLTFDENIAYVNVDKKLPPNDIEPKMHDDNKLEVHLGEEDEDEDEEEVEFEIPTRITSPVRKAPTNSQSKASLGEQYAFYGSGAKLVLNKKRRRKR